MARIESIAIGGYYPTPPHIVDLIATWFDSSSNPTIMDPCAGEGAAVYKLRDVLAGRVAAVEMESTRFSILEKKAKWADKFAHGDFFQLQARGSGDILYLNPPYDMDKAFKRLEERFLVRANHLLAKDGWLVYIIPYYALAASAKTLASNYRNFECYRFPGDDWSSYKQIVLFAQKNGNSMMDAIMEDQIMGWAGDADTIPEMGVCPHDKISIGKYRYNSISTWEIVGADLTPVSDMDPWAGATGFQPPADVHGMFHKEYPLASRPRAAHISAALTAGIFNGVTVTSERPGYPPLMVKGVFDREWKTVEDKHNKNGEKVAEVQVQQPKLSVTVLDMTTGLVHSIRHEAETSHCPAVDNLTMGDLLNLYGPSLMQGMLKSCPVLYDPTRGDPTLPTAVLNRPLFPAQADAVQTILKLHEQDPNRGVVVLGEIGSGKSSVALATLAALGKQSTLIVAPPHLLDSWRDQVAAVIPDYSYHVLETVSDIQAFFALDEKKIGVLSRERAKLGHGWETIAGSCPSCGQPLAALDYAKTRSTCDHSTITPKDAIAKWLVRFVQRIAIYMPKHVLVQHLCKGKVWEKRLEKARKDQKKGVLLVVDDLLQELATYPEIWPHRDLVRWLAWTCPDVVPTLHASYMKRSSSLNNSHDTLQFAMFAAEPGHGLEIPTSLYGYSGQHAEFTSWYNYVWGVQPKNSYSWVFNTISPGESLDGVPSPTMDKVERRSTSALERLLDSFTAATATFKRKACGEFLYQAVATPRRYPLAQYISRYYKDAYDMLIVDEAHEFSNVGSAQTKSAQRLMGSKKAFNLLLTGSFMNGYAESVFMNMYAISPMFRKQFQREDTVQFIDRFGYWKQTIQDRDHTGGVVEFGKNSDRVTRTARKSGVAPGILPVFQLEHLLPLAVTLQKEDLRLGIPPCNESILEVHPTALQAQNYEYLMKELMAEIKRTRNEEGRAGKLWGALAQLPGYLDLAAMGEDYEVRWPEACGGEVIASVPSLDPSELLPKEQWMLDQVRSEVSEGRNVLVMGWHLKLLPRFVRILQEQGFKVAHLESAKVPTEKRQDWIDKHVIAKKVQVLVVNPVTVQTGLNNLVYFATELWMENPMCSPFVYRQACGRVDRIGQTVPTKILFPVYQDTAQVNLHKLLMHKVGVSKSVDGIDPEEALRAAGLLGGEYSGFSLGKQLYHMIMGEEE